MNDQSAEPLDVTALFAQVKMEIEKISFRKQHITLVLGSDRGIGREAFALEKRVGITPSQARLLREFLQGFDLRMSMLVVRGAGTRAGFADEAYVNAGAEVVDWWELAHLDEPPDVVHALKEPSAEELHVRPPFFRIGALHTGDFRTDAPFLKLIESGVSIFDGSSVGAGFRIPIRGSMSLFAGRNGAERMLGHLERNGLAGKVVVVGAGYVGKAAAAVLMAASTVSQVVLFEDKEQPKRLAEAKSLAAGQPKLEVQACTGLDDKDLQSALVDAVGVILAVAKKGQTTPRVVSTGALAVMRNNALVVDISIDEGGAIHDDGLKQGWSHDEIVPHLKKTIALGKHVYWALANMPRAYPGEASQVHGETVLPYLMALLLLSAQHGGHERALEYIRCKPLSPNTPSPLDTRVSERFNALISDLRNGLAFHRHQGRIVMEANVARRTDIARHLYSREIGFEVALLPKDADTLAAASREQSGLPLPVVDGLRRAAEYGIECSLIYHPGQLADSTGSSARAVGADRTQVIKALALARPHEESLDLAILPGDTMLDEAWLNGRSLAKPEAILRQTGFLSKSIPLFGLLGRMPTFISEDLHERVDAFTSAGDRYMSIRFAVKDLLQIKSLQRAALARPESGMRRQEETLRGAVRRLERAIDDNDPGAADAEVNALARVLAEGSQMDAARRCRRRPLTAVVRPLDDTGVCAKLVELQVRTWGTPAREALPGHLLTATTFIGGVILCAFPADDPTRLVGFAAALPAIEAGSSFLYLHQLGVDPEFTGLGIGHQLLLSLKAASLQRGIHRVDWTFDPLDLVSARLYLHKVDASAVRFQLSMYPREPGRADAMDRCYATWSLDTPPRGRLPDPVQSTLVLSRNIASVAIDQGEDTLVKLLTGDDDCVAVEWPEGAARRKEKSRFWVHKALENAFVKRRQWVDLIRVGHRFFSVFSTSAR